MYKDINEVRIRIDEALIQLLKAFAMKLIEDTKKKKREE